jgi:hypothetical protein
MKEVQHETADYHYAPQGLMAENWGKTGTRTDPPSFVRESVLRARKWMDNDQSRDALMYILSLDDATLRAGMTEGTPEHAEICRRLGGSTWESENGKVDPLWVTAQCATESYDRGLITGEELDRIIGD